MASHGMQLMALRAAVDAGHSAGPTTFELVIHKKAAGALGLTICQPLLVRADQITQ